MAQQGHNTFQFYDRGTNTLKSSFMLVLPRKLHLQSYMYIHTHIFDSLSYETRRGGRGVGSQERKKLECKNKQWDDQYVNGGGVGGLRLLTRQHCHFRYGYLIREVHREVLLVNKCQIIFQQSRKRPLNSRQFLQAAILRPAPHIYIVWMLLYSSRFVID